VDEALTDGYQESPLTAPLFVTGTFYGLESVYQTLTTVDGNVLYQNGTVITEPDLAQSWTVSANGTNYVYNLRQGVTFSNGDPFNCYQVWAEWYNAYYAQSNASNFMEGYAIYNFTNVNFGPSVIDMMNGTGIVNPSGQLLSLMQNNAWPFSCPNASTLVVNLKNPFAYAPLVFSQYAGVMLDTQFIINHGGFGFFPGNPVFQSLIIPGTGPYTVTQISPNAYEEFQQNPNYWGENLTTAQLQNNPYIDPGHYKTIFVYYKPDDLVRYTDLSTGAAQVVTINAQDWPLIRANPSQYGSYIIPNQSMIVEGIGMNTLRSPTNITLIRQAIVHAINYTALWHAAFFDEAAPLIGPEYSAFTQYYDLGNLPPYNYNLTQAMADINASGVNVAKLPPISFLVDTGCGVCISTAQVIQSDLAAIGLTVNIGVIPTTENAFPYVAGYGPYSQSLNYSQQEANFVWMGYPSYAPNAPTPADAWLAFLQTQGVGADYANYGNNVTQKCVNDWTTTGNQAQIISDCTAAYLRIYQDAPYIWLASPKLAFASGSLAYSKAAIKSLLMDPSFTGESTTAILNTVVPN
jgi:peptide/nickel transport system substrate-binding protein